MKIVICGLSITSSWGNGHATTYRALVRELSRLGHEVLFLERDRPWYAENRDLPNPPYGQLVLYQTLEEFKDRFTEAIAAADVVIQGSFVPEGVALGAWVLAQARGLTAFYDIDTPVTVAGLRSGSCEYLDAQLAGRYDLYLSFTGGPILRRIEREFGSPCARPLFCSVDLDDYFPEETRPEWDLAYLGTYSTDRQPKLETLLFEPAQAWREGSFLVAGAQYPEETGWPANVRHIAHLPPTGHRAFYNSQRFTLNITRADMTRAGFSPSVRLFEAAACGTPIITDFWPGLDWLFEIGSEILVAESAAQVLSYLREIPEERRLRIGERGRKRVIAQHSSRLRVRQLLEYILEALELKAGKKRWKARKETTSLTR